MIDSLHEHRAKIAVLLANRENRRLLGDVLAERFDVLTSVAETDDGSDDGPFDLCIVDGLMLQQHRRLFVHLRRTHAPTFLPVLLVAERSSLDGRSPGLWEAIDDVLYRPVERLELIARVQSLLRTRKLSRQARTLTTLYKNERAIAQRLQESVLPRQAPAIPGLYVDAVYRPADVAARVGGDWYDVLRLSDGRVVVSIGDVSGSGLDAAIAMSQVRQVLRAVAHVHSDPALMLDAAERTWMDQDEQKQISVFVGVIDLVECELTYASAGHPPPFVRNAEGVVESLPCDGLLLGTPVRLPRASKVRPFPNDTMLVLYTDGVTEATRDPLEGEDRLRNALAHLPSDAQRPARALADALRATESDDDVALVTICHTAVPRSGATRRWVFDSCDLRAADAAQRAYRETLRTHGLSTAALTNAETILAELLGNVVRYAPGDAEIVVDLTARAPILHVLDRGRGFQHFPKLPLDVLSESGRGLYIVSRLTDEFTVTRRSTGGSHARVVLALSPNP